MTHSLDPAANSPARRWPPRRQLERAHPAHLRRIIAEARIELVPMASLERAITELRPASRVSMTCSPAKSIEATLDASQRSIAAGHRVTPHIAARMVESLDHLGAIHARLGSLGIRDIFVVAGDASPPGCCFDAAAFLDAFIQLDDADGASRRHVDHIGFTAYPDTHPLIPAAQLHTALHHKQALILGSARSAHVSTQMCFDPDKIRAWLHAERARGLSVPVHLGIPGAIDTARLLTTGMRLGVGPSLRYLKQNRSALRRLVARRTFDPDSLLRPLGDDLRTLGVDGLHLYSFNQVEATEAWRERALR